MKTKLTLTVEEDAVVRAKRLAKRSGVSVSALFEKWSKRAEGDKPQAQLGQRLRGKWKADSLATEDARLAFLLEKHR